MGNKSNPCTKIKQIHSFYPYHLNILLLMSNLIPNYPFFQLRITSCRLTMNAQLCMSNSLYHMQLLKNQCIKILHRLTSLCNTTTSMTTQNQYQELLLHLKLCTIPSTNIRIQSPTNPCNILQLN